MPTTTIGPQYVGHADGTCYDDSCKDTGGCAKITPLVAKLPSGSEVTAIRLYSAGPGRTDLHQNNACDDIQWARWLEPEQSTTPDNTVVTARFKNWSHDQERYVKMEVDWK